MAFFVRQATLCNSRYFLLRNFSSSSSKVFDVTRLTGKQEGIIVFGMNRPEAKNTWNPEFLQLYFEAMQGIKHDTSARALIIRSLVPGMFSVGADLKARAKMKPEEVGPFVSSARRAVADLEVLPMPVIAAIDGYALGGGLELTLAADIRVAAENAKMGLTETKLAIIPGGGGTQRLPRLVGLSKGKELIFTGEMVDGKEAERIGLVSYCVSQNEAGDAAFQKALSIAEKIVVNGPVAVRMAKNAITKGCQVDLTTGLAIEEACYAQVIPTKDRIEGLTAFSEKRPPKYIGK